MAAPGSDITFYEKMTDIYEKISGVSRVVVGLLPGGRFQLTTASVRGHETTVFKQLPPSLGEFYKVWFKEFAKNEWIVYEDERYSFGDTLKIYEAMGAAFASEFNIKPGDRVGIVMRNYPELLLAFLAATSMGAVAVPFNALWKSEELEYAVKDSGCKLIIGDPQRLELCAPFKETLGIQTICVRGEAPGAASWDAVLANHKGKKAPKSKVGPEDEAMIMYTSGSTGFPKGVCHTQRGVGTAMKLGELMGAVMPDPGGCALMAVPLFHITALSPIALCSIPVGGKLVMMRKWDAGKAIDTIQKEKVTRFTGVPTMVRDMLEHPNFTPEKVSTMKNMLAGGAPVPPSQVAKMRSKTKNIKSGQGYGLTETMAFATVISGNDYIKNPTSCGKAIPLIVQVEIRDPETNKAVKDGQRGEVCIKSPMIMKCYYNRPEDTAKAIDSDGFFHSGDIGKIESGFVYILDRMKDIIIRGGENIDCSEVEAALNENSGVRECSVFGLPDERLGEVVGAAIWVDEGVTQEDLIKTAKGILANFKVPLPENIFLYSEELPKGATGKLDKKGLRAHYGEIVAARPVRSML